MRKLIKKISNFFFENFFCKYLYLVGGDSLPKKIKKFVMKVEKISLKIYDGYIKLFKFF